MLVELLEAFEPLRDVRAWSDVTAAASPPMQAAWLKHLHSATNNTFCDAHITRVAHRTHARTHTRTHARTHAHTHSRSERDDNYSVMMHGGRNSIICAFVRTAGGIAKTP
jgi:hypothetical protein